LLLFFRAIIANNVLSVVFFFDGGVAWAHNIPHHTRARARAHVLSADTHTLSSIETGGFGSGGDQIMVATRSKGE
jgi:hypothetical protein